MSEYRELPPDVTRDTKEYSFEEGVAEAVTRIKEVLKDRDFACVSVTGSGIMVGKTTTSAAIHKGLKRAGVETRPIGDSSIISKVCFSEDSPKHVIVLEAEWIPYPGSNFTTLEKRRSPAGIKDAKRIQDTKLAAKFKKIGVPIEKIDLRVFVYRPDQPFEDDETNCADIIIRNELAKDR